MNGAVIYSGPSAHTTAASALTLVVPLVSLLLLFALAWFMRRRLLTGAGPLAAPMPPSPDPLSPDDAGDPLLDPSPNDAPTRRPAPPEPPEH